MRTTRNYKRSTLFLVRLWRTGSGDNEGTGKWQGIVRRVTDGESREFNGLAGLTEMLQALVPDTNGGKEDAGNH